MNARLQKLFDALEMDRVAILKSVADLPAVQLIKARPGSWSAIQILAHLITAEKLSLRYMNKKILGISDAANTGIAEELKMLLLKVSQRLPLKFKAPKTVLDNTLTYGDLTALAADWEKERNELRVFLEKFSDNQIRKKVYRHVRAGMLNVHQALIFFREHQNHHLPQLKRLI